MSRKTLAQVLGKAHRRKYDDYGISWVDSKQLIGVEIEAEHLGNGTYLPGAEELSGLWQAKSDGSLRNGIEYVLSRPMAGSELATAVQAFFETARVKKAITSGTHIHVDMLDPDKNVTCAQALFLLVYVIEPAIYSIADAGREWCGFTNSLQEAPSKLIAAMLRDGVEDDPRQLVDIVRRGRELKYYGLNFQPLSNYGSVEFRYFPTAESREELIGWINLAQSIVKAAKELDTKENVEALLDSQERYEQYVDSTFPEHASKILQVVPYALAKKRLAQAKLNYAMTQGVPQSSDFSDVAASVRRFSRFFGSASSKRRNAITERERGPDFARTKIYVSHTENISQLYARINGQTQLNEGDLLLAYNGIIMRTTLGPFNVGGREYVYLCEHTNSRERYKKVAEMADKYFARVERAIATSHRHGLMLQGAVSQSRINQVLAYYSQFRESALEVRELYNMGQSEVNE